MSKVKPWIKSHKKITAAVLVVPIAFLILNCVWGIHHYMVFGNYEKITIDTIDSGLHCHMKDKKIFSVSSKKYLSFEGNLSINDSENKCFLLVWPKLNGEPDIGITLGEYDFYIDKNGNLARDYDDISKKIYEENRELAMSLLNDYNEWTKAAENNDKTFFSEESMENA
ncbi:MAG: hypothetical protein RSB11_02315 [Oscillospiraceae bacterium]